MRWEGTTRCPPHTSGSWRARMRYGRCPSYPRFHDSSAAHSCSGSVMRWAAGRLTVRHRHAELADHAVGVVEHRDRHAVHVVEVLLLVARSRTAWTDRSRASPADARQVMSRALTAWWSPTTAGGSWTAPWRPAKCCPPSALPSGRTPPSSSTAEFTHGQDNRCRPSTPSGCRHGPPCGCVRPDGRRRAHGGNGPCRTSRPSAHPGDAAPRCALHRPDRDPPRP